MNSVTNLVRDEKLIFEEYGSFDANYFLIFYATWHQMYYTMVAIGILVNFKITLINTLFIL